MTILDGGTFECWSWDESLELYLLEGGEGWGREDLWVTMATLPLVVLRASHLADLGSQNVL